MVINVFEENFERCEKHGVRLINDVCYICSGNGIVTMSVRVNLIEVSSIKYF